MEIITSELGTLVAKKNSRQAYEKFIASLEKIRENFYYPTTQEHLEAFIRWLKEENEKPFEERAKDDIYLYWEEKINKVLQQETLKQGLDVLMTDFKILKNEKQILSSFRKFGASKLRDEKVKKYIIKREKTYDKAIQNLVEMTTNLEEYAEGDLKTLIMDFKAWLKKDIQNKPAYQADNTEYTRWKEKLLYCASQQIPSQFFSWRERLKIMMLKFRYHKI